MVFTALQISYNSCAAAPLRSLRETHMTEPQDKIPFFKTWHQWYLFVILFLCVLILAFYWLTKYFA